MTTQILLHVGMTKTATTTLQYAFDAQREDLLAAGVLYPRSGRYPFGSPAHHALFVHAASHRDRILTPYPPSNDKFEDLVAEVEAEREETGAKTIIFSSENLWDSPSFDKNALARIRDGFANARFVIVPYLRPLESHILSGYAQRVTGAQRYTNSFKQHTSEMFGRLYYDYSGRLGQFAEVFGEDAVQPVWLPGLNRDVMSPFRELLPELENITTFKDQNVRRNWLYITVKKRLNRLEKMGLGRVTRILERILGKADTFVGRGSYIDQLLEPMDEETRQDLIQQSTVALEQLRSRYNLRGA